MKKTFVVKKKRKIERDLTHRMFIKRLFVSFFILVTFFIGSCKYPKEIRKYPRKYRTYLYESYNDHLSGNMYYSIMGNDTFYYSPGYNYQLAHGGPYRDGWFLHVFDNQIREKKFVEGGRTNGSYFKYYRSGNLYIEGNMIGNMKQGVFLVFADSSELIITKIMHYNRDSLINEYVFENDSIKYKRLMQVRDE